MSQLCKKKQTKDSVSIFSQMVEIQYVATNCWFAEANAQFLLHK